MHVAPNRFALIHVLYEEIRAAGLPVLRPVDDGRMDDDRKSLLSQGQQRPEDGGFVLLREAAGRVDGDKAKVAKVERGEGCD